jgi:hypothetical protein
MDKNTLARKYETKIIATSLRKLMPEPINVYERARMLPRGRGREGE